MPRAFSASATPASLRATGQQSVRIRLAGGGRWIRPPGPGSKGRRFRRTTEGAGAFERTVCGWDLEFESPLLQQRVACEPGAYSNKDFVEGFASKFRPLRSSIGP